MFVTDYEWIDPRFGKKRRGFYMDEYLAVNLMGVPKYLKKSYDVVGIISGHSRVRVGKSCPSLVTIKTIENGVIVDKPIGSFKDKDKIKTLSYDFKNNKYVISDSEVIQEIEEKDFYEVILSSGEKVQCTMKHKLFIYEDGIVKEKRLEDIKEGDLLICQKDNPNKYRCPKLFYLKGAFDGDGHYNHKSKRITFNVTDYDFISEVQSLIQKIFNININIRDHVEATETTKKQWRINLTTIKKLGFNPCEFFQSLTPESPEEKIEYLKGLFDAEGSVGICDKLVRNKYTGKEKWLTLSQKDIAKLELWSSYLNEFGIDSIKTYKKDTRSYLSIRNNYSIKQFNELIGFRIKRKQDVLNRIIANASKNKLSKQDYEKIVDIYNHTLFGTTYIGLMFGRSSVTIKAALNLRKVKMIDKKNKPISYTDIQYAENILGYKLPFKINKGKLDSNLHNTDMMEKTINQFNISELNNIRDFKKKINLEMTDKYFNRDEEAMYFITPLLLQEQPEEQLQQFKININKSDLITKQITSIKFYSREKGYDLYTEEYHNFFFSNGILSHNSTLALQIGYFLAWLNAGGIMKKEEASGKWFVTRGVKRKIKFNLEENVVFSPEDLQRRARELFRKYGPNQVIIYDEGRAGLDSAAAMTVINKAMQDFFQECGQYGHIILIVLPNFFKLHEDYAISRSIFLADVFTNRRMERGFFNFYNEHQKEMLYIIGKKKTGTQSKYSGARPSFYGRFSRFLPLDKEAYELAKQNAIKQKEVKVTEKKWKRQRDAALYLLSIRADITPVEIAKEMSTLCQENISSSVIKFGIQAILNKLDPTTYGKF